MPTLTLPIVGAKYHDGALDRMKALAEGAPLRLVREAHNRHDSMAVAVQTVEGLMLGYLPRGRNVAVAQALDMKLALDAVAGEPSAATDNFCPAVIRW